MKQALANISTRRAPAAGVSSPCPSLHPLSHTASNGIEAARPPRCSIVSPSQARLLSSGGNVTDAGRNYKIGTTYGGLLVSRLVSSSQGIDEKLFGRSPQDWRRFTARITQASWLELRDLLPATAAQWAGADTICLTAAFSSLARAATGRGGHKGAASDLERAEMAAAAAMLLRIARPRLAEFDVQGLVTVAVSMAKMKEECLAEGWLCALPATAGVGEAASPFSPRAGSSSGTSSSSSSSSASDLDAVGSQTLSFLFNELLHHCGLVIHQFTPQALANLMWALATVGHQPCGKWLTEYYRRLDDQLPELKSQDVANILWSLCKLDLMPDIWLRDGLVERALDAVREQKGTSGQDAATLVQCLARWYYLYNYRVPDEYLSEYLTIVSPSLGTYLPFDLVAMMHSCVVMNYQPSRLWMAGYYAHIMRCLKHDPTLSYSDFQRLFWALSRVDYTPPLIWQREFVAISIPKLKHLKIRALSEFVWTLACWGCRPSPQWLAEFFTVSHPRLSDARPQHISCQLNALAKLGVDAPGPWLDEALASFCAQLPEAKAHDLVTVLDTITTVCGDRTWLLGHSDTIRHLADIAAHKFAVYDAVMHTKLCVALAAANVIPAADWLTKQQAALVACLRGGETVGQAGAQDLREVYRGWDVEMEGELQHLL